MFIRESHKKLFAILYRPFAFKMTHKDTLNVILLSASYFPFIVIIQ